MKIFDVKCRGTIDTQLFVLPKQLPQFVSPWLTIVHGTIMECIDFASIVYRRLKNVLNKLELLKNDVTKTFLNPLSLISTRPFHIIVEAFISHLICATFQQSIAASVGLQTSQYPSIIA